MATRELVTKVWIEEGCIVCDACETAAPDVFEVQEDTCIIKPAALEAEFNKPRTQGIIEAAEECPVDVIKFDTVAVEVSDEEAAAATAVSEAAETAEVTADESPQTPGVAASAEPAQEHVSAPIAKTPRVGETDPAIQALLGAATTRGGHAVIRKRAESIPEAVEAWKHKDPSELPPDARQAKILEAARKVGKDPDAKRRAVVSGVALTVGWTAFGAGTGLSFGPALARFMMPNVLEEPDPSVRVGKLQQYAEMQPGSVNEDHKSEGIWMIRDGDRIAALSIICTHLGCIPNWLPNDRKFKCPCHGSGYKPDGINFEGPTPRPLERFRLYVEDGIVVVDKSKKYQYELGQWDVPESYLEV